MINIAVSCSQTTPLQMKEIHLQDWILQNEVMIVDREQDDYLDGEH